MRSIVNIWTKIIFLIFIISFSFETKGQNISLDTIIYQGTLSLKNEQFTFKKVTQIFEKLDKRFNVNQSKIANAEDETLIIFDKTLKEVLNFKLSEVVADHNNATISRTLLLISDSSIKLTRYNYWWATYPLNESVGLERFEYSINNLGAFYLKDSSSIFSNNPNEKLKITKIENSNFRQIIKAGFNKEIDRQKMYAFLK